MGISTFEFSLYNSEVRDLVNNGETHNNYDDNWGEQRYVQIEAIDEQRARKELEKRYPQKKGFVCTSVLNL